MHIICIHILLIIIISSSIIVIVSYCAAAWLRWGGSALGRSASERV